MENTSQLGFSTAHRISGETAESVERRKRPKTGIVHFGVGNFHRSHQAVYVDKLIAQGLGDSWGICGIGLMDRDREMEKVLRNQDYLYTLTTRYPNGTDQTEVISSIQDFLLASESSDAVIEILADPSTRIVSLTVTEGAYLGASVDDDQLTSDTALGREVASGLKHPETVWGYIVAGLKLRVSRGIAPFTVLSCDNMQHNGRIARNSTVLVAGLVDAEFATWIDREVAFPSTMVDRITPTTVESDLARIQDNFGLIDSWPVTCEPFSQWILEDNFPLGRPELEQVGAFFTDDIEPFEATKLRLLNGPHQAIAYIGQLAGYTYVDEAMADLRIRRFTEKFMAEEVQKSFVAPESLDVIDYSATVIERFSNPTIKDPLIRLSVDSTDRMPIFVVPVAHDLAVKGFPTKQTAAVIATWCAYWGIPSDSERSSDRNAEKIIQAARAGMETPAQFLEMVPSLAPLLSAPQFVADFEAAIELLHLGADQFLEVYSN